MEDGINHEADNLDSAPSKMGRSEYSDRANSNSAKPSTQSLAFQANLTPEQENRLAASAAGSGYRAIFNQLYKSKTQVENNQIANYAAQIQALNQQQFEAKMDTVINNYREDFKTVADRIAEDEKELARIEKIKPVTLGDGTVVYLDEDTGQYFKRDDDGNYQSLSNEQQAEAQSRADSHDGSILTIQLQHYKEWLQEHIKDGYDLLEEGQDKQQQASQDRANAANISDDDRGALAVQHAQEQADYSSKANQYANDSYDTEKQFHSKLQHSIDDYKNSTGIQNSELEQTNSNSSQSGYSIPSL